MAPTKSPSSPISIGNCEVVVEAGKFTSELKENSLKISLSKNVKVKISVVDDGKCSKECKSRIEYEENGNYCFVLFNPKDDDGKTKSLLQDVLNIYSKELPDMNYAANTGKESQFLERCVLNGKYCTLVLKTKEGVEPGEVIAAITYQIIPADTQFAEVPLAAVKSVYQHKGIGHLMYLELRKRLQHVGVRTVLCWGDKESEGFWLKQGFSVIGQVDTKGRARRLPIKADIRKALCFLGGSNLMISHFNKDNLHGSAVYLNLKFPLKPSRENCRSPILQEQRDTLSEGDNLSQSRNHAAKTADSNYNDCQDFQPGDGAVGSRMHVRIGFNESESQALLKKCSCSASGSKKRTWETSSTSVKSKKIKGGHQTHCDLHAKDTSLESVTRNSFSAVSKSKCPVGITPNDHLTSQFVEKNAEGATTVNLTYEEHTSRGIFSRGTNFRIMLMNIADDRKKANLTKIIGVLGGDVTSDGSLSTHVVTGKVRKTLNFCSALCSGAWILSPSWLKESFRNGKFIDEMPFILRDEDYELKYRTELKGAVLRAKAYPQALLKDYDICLAAHIHPPVGTLSSIVKSAGGNVICGLDQVKDESKTIFIACEEDMDEALSAVKKGIWTFSSDWFMNCVMKQELDLGAPQFAESL
ncbi:Peptide chain release factor 2 isoform 1 [Capsicum annuum]|nr:Peptide chain release factor 2 isoform 1 [Capsicum annuum]